MYQCPYCGKPTIDDICPFCNHALQIKTAGEILYNMLIRDLEELSMNKDWREFWYFRAESLKNLDKQLYYQAMNAAKKYNEEIKEQNRKTNLADNTHRLLCQKFGLTTLRGMTFFELKKAHDNVEKEMLKREGPD